MKRRRTRNGGGRGRGRGRGRGSEEGTRQRKKTVAAGGKGSGSAGGTTAMCWCGARAVDGELLWPSAALPGGCRAGFALQKRAFVACYGASRLIPGQVLAPRPVPGCWLAWAFCLTEISFCDHPRRFLAGAGPGSGHPPGPRRFCLTEMCFCGTRGQFPAEAAFSPPWPVLAPRPVPAGFALQK